MIEENSAATGYMLVLQYSDRSGIIGAFGPFPTPEAAWDAEQVLKHWPLADGVLETVPLFGVPGVPPWATSPSPSAVDHA